MTVCGFKENQRYFLCLSYYDAAGNCVEASSDNPPVLMLGCDTDIHSMQPGLPEGSLVSLLCPVSCEACHRTGMGKWIETPSECPWRRLWRPAQCGT